MITRRTFIGSATASTAAVPLAGASAHEEDPRRPLRAEPRAQAISGRVLPDGRVRLFTDAAPHPLPLIREEALDRAFGKGAGQALFQPDHWRMIAKGWFGEDDLFTPSDPTSLEFAVWQANHHPECEAHDLLAELFGAGLSPVGGHVRALGLALSEHPCTPRYATATLDHPGFLPILAAEVAARTEWITVRPAPQP
jgi:hypothetical protein